MSQLLKRRHTTPPTTDPFSVFDQGLSMFRSPMLGTLPSVFGALNIDENEFLDIGIDVYEMGEDIVIDALLPGITRENLDVTVVDDNLTIRAERKTEDVKKDKNFFRKEVKYGSLIRTIPMPVPVDETRVTASFKDGLLTVHAPMVDVRGTSRKVPID